MTRSLPKIRTPRNKREICLDQTETSMSTEKRAWRSFATSVEMRSGDDDEEDVE